MEDLEGVLCVTESINQEVPTYSHCGSIFSHFRVVTEDEVRKPG